MPKWADVVGYEEGDPEVVAIMKIGMQYVHIDIYTHIYMYMFMRSSDIHS